MKKKHLIYLVENVFFSCLFKSIVFSNARVYRMVTFGLLDMLRDMYTFVCVLHLKPEGEITWKEFTGWGEVIQDSLWCKEDIFSAS